MEAFISLQYARGSYGKHLPIDTLWSKTAGMTLFRETMSRDRFKFILRCLRIDSKTTRRFRVHNDKLTHIREIFTQFTENCKNTHIPDFSLTVDEQLMPLKSRCPFIMFMPNKPDKFGVKFWMLVEVKTKYVVCVIPYLGKENDCARARSLSEEVILNLLESVKNQGYNLTMDNYFTSLPLAAHLMALGTSLVGTLRNNRRELPKDFLKSDKKLSSTKTSFTQMRQPVHCCVNTIASRTELLYCCLRCITDLMWT